ncbi:MAG: enoyl-CoA hydratase/isomerase family protein [Acidobacteriaceae bacterium]
MTDLLVSKQGACGRITLNRPQAINALTLDMVREMYRALTAWADDPEIEFILLDGAGERGLCAGGDIRTLYGYAVSHDLDSAATFFQEEYRLNYYIARYPKPYVALMDGIVMGGGIGISAHGSYRVVTERSALAMPEVKIGFIPDVGGTFLLGKAPAEFGTYLALTGRRAGAADAILCGLADRCIASERLPILKNELLNCHSCIAVNTCLESFTTAPPQGDLENGRTWMMECFAKDSIEAILSALKARPEEAAHEVAAEMRKGSPTSLKVTLLALRRGRNYGLLERCLQQEFALALLCLEKGDFSEGVRASLVDKDRNPVWKPSSLEEVTPERVISFFHGPELPREFLGHGSAR